MCLSILEPLQSCPVSGCCDVVLQDHCPRNADFIWGIHSFRNAGLEIWVRIKQQICSNLSAGQTGALRGRHRTVAGGKGTCPGEGPQSESGFTTCVCVRGQRTSLPCSSDPSFYKNQGCEYIPHGDIGRVWHTLRGWKTPEIEIPQECY